MYDTFNDSNAKLQRGKSKYSSIKANALTEQQKQEIRKIRKRAIDEDWDEYEMVEALRAKGIPQSEIDKVDIDYP